MEKEGTRHKFPNIKSVMPVRYFEGKMGFSSPLMKGKLVILY